ncbi:MAG: hypothetical protein JGK24_17110 [Microcoleus sp. PH2017_29_MFU_D_A]|uniref:hypothetical protein n=1 Tax=unclassified Microcoleus TaxID=2642155 RepID=UPI001E178D27|nr:MULTISPECIES: hypothetical protein [unclassified Microcoleus]MCC3584287.1 hypothetical protein [Microcoleus sp. PH2017_30_WIL_O_A]MCC3604889.1 hypothetical protein [Microcoleus sp. PH2017_29_MFU_D_A]MCC3635815.1 hypothetical protein [Microcoleus sp. PH2017_37_MFU_D_B]
MPAPLAFIPLAIKLGVGAAKAATATKVATAAGVGAKVGLGVLPLTAAPIVPVAKVVATGAAAAKVSVVTGAVPLGLKSAAVTGVTAKVSAGLGSGKIGQVLGIAALKGVAAVQVDQALKGDQKPKVATRAPIGDPRQANRTQTQPQTQPQTRSPIGDPRQANRTQTQPQAIGRADPFAPIAPEFDEPTIGSRSPKMSPIKGLDTTPAGALSIPGGKAGGRINLGAIDSSRQGLSTPTSLDQVEKGGINLLTPIVDFLKGLDLDIQELKNPDFSPLLEQIQQMINPVSEQVKELPKTILSGITELLNPIVGLITTTLEGVIKIPQLNADAMIETIAPLLLGLLILESLFENLTDTIKGLNLKMQVEIPQGLAMQVEVPQGLAMQMEVPQGLAMQMEVPQGLAMQVEVPQGLAMQVEVPQGLAMQVEVPQTLTVATDLPNPDIETKLKKLQKTAEETKKELEKCCKDIADKLKKKKKEDDDRFPEFKSSGSIECDGVTIPYSYSGPGLVGLHKQLDVILGVNKMALKKICDIEYSASFPDIFGGGTYACGSTIFNYDYSGAGLLGLSDQVEELTALNKKILAEVCGDDIDIAGEIDFVDCNGGTQILLYSGDGIAGLSSQISAFTELQKLTYAKACETPGCYPVQPGDEFAEFDVPRQLVLTWGQDYPKQTGSLWHTQIPNPREDLEWCRDFDNLIYTKGNIYGRLLWGASKIKSGVRAETEEEAERILGLIDDLSVSEGKLRITKGGAVKLNPAVRSVRCVRAAIAQLGANGVPETVKCFVPPIEGC